MSKIEDRSLTYTLASFWVKFSLKKLYYREVYVNNIENIPKSGPIMFAPNHQNALMDPLCLVSTVKNQIFFLARSDIFKSKAVARILKFMKMLPVYRMRDGYKTLQANEEIFDQCAIILAKNCSLCIMPEGDHGDVKRLRRLKKGFVRVAFRAEKSVKNGIGLKIVPVGLEYKNVNKFRTRLLINYGKPINVKEFLPLYQENKQAGFKALNEEIRKGLIPLMININTMEIHDLLVILRDIYNSRMKNKLDIQDGSYYSAFKADKKMIEIFEDFYKKNPEKIDYLSNLSIKYITGLEKLKLRDHILKNRNYPLIKVLIRALILLVLLPVQLFTIINNYIPYKIPVWIVNKKILADQFNSTLSYVLSFLVLFPIFYLIIFFVLFIITNNILISIIYLLLAAFGGLFAIHYWFHLKKLFGRLKFISLMKNNNHNIVNLLEMREKIFRETDEIIDGGLK